MPIVGTNRAEEEALLHEHAKQAIGDAADFAGPAAAILSVLADIVPDMVKVNVYFEGQGGGFVTVGMDVSTAGGSVQYVLTPVGDGVLQAHVRNVTVERGATW